MVTPLERGVVQIVYRIFKDYYKVDLEAMENPVSEETSCLLMYKVRFFTVNQRAKAGGGSSRRTPGGSARRPAKASSEVLAGNRWLIRQ